MRLWVTILTFVDVTSCMVPPVSHLLHYASNDLSETLLRSKREVIITDRELCKPGKNYSQQMVNTTARLHALRTAMSKHSVAYIIPSEDEHQSAYVADYDKRRQYISGFSGSSGIAVVTMQEAALWTDGRYFVQAEQELDCNWLLMKAGVSGYPTITEWLRNRLPENSYVSADPRLVPYVLWQSWTNDLKLKQIQLMPQHENLIDRIWTESDGRPLLPKNPIYILEDRFTGKSWIEKIFDLRQMLIKIEADLFVVTSLDEIAWLFNLRGSDVPHNPLFHAYALVTHTYIRLYVKNPETLTEEAKNSLKLTNCSKSTCVRLGKYENVLHDLIRESVKYHKVLISSESSYAVYIVIPEENKIIDTSPISKMKVVKNPIEQRNMKQAHIKDAIALMEFLSILEKEVPEEKLWDELKAKNKLEELRRKQTNYKGSSFQTISAVGPNAAIIHYSTKESTNRKLTTSEIFLLDSGGQYLEGTTDVTRTMHYGTPKDFEKEAYTRVLMGHIDLAMTVFPMTVVGSKLDIIARVPLWEAGLDYRHGTGHGIGAFLCVHEGPIRITSQTTQFDVPFQPGMFISDEPGYYESGKFGIRLESILMAKTSNPPQKFENVTYLSFEPITLVPFEPKLIKFELLNNKQRKWLNRYNQKIREVIGVEFQRQNKTDVYNWMYTKTQSISNDCSCIASTNKQSHGLQIYSFILASGIFTKLFWL